MKSLEILKTAYFEKNISEKDALEILEDREKLLKDAGLKDFFKNIKNVFKQKPFAGATQKIEEIAEKTIPGGEAQKIFTETSKKQGVLGAIKNYLNTPEGTAWAVTGLAPATVALTFGVTAKLKKKKDIDLFASSFAKNFPEYNIESIKKEYASLLNMSPIVAKRPGLARRYVLKGLQDNISIEDLSDISSIAGTRARPVLPIQRVVESLEAAAIPVAAAYYGENPIKALYGLQDEEAVLFGGSAALAAEKDPEFKNKLYELLKTRRPLEKTSGVFSKSWDVFERISPYLLVGAGLGVSSSLLAGTKSYIRNKKEQNETENSFLEIMKDPIIREHLKENPKLNAENVARTFDILARFAPSLAATPEIAKTFVRNRLAQEGEVGYEQIRPLVEMQKIHEENIEKRDPLGRAKEGIKAGFPMLRDVGSLERTFGGQ